MSSISAQSDGRKVTLRDSTGKKIGEVPVRAGMKTDFRLPASATAPASTVEEAKERGRKQGREEVRKDADAEVKAIRKEAAEEVFAVREGEQRATAQALDRAAKDGTGDNDGPLWEALEEVLKKAPLDEIPGIGEKKEEQIVEAISDALRENASAFLPVVLRTLAGRIGLGGVFA